MGDFKRFLKSLKVSPEKLDKEFSDYVGKLISKIDKDKKLNYFNKAKLKITLLDAIRTNEEARKRTNELWEV